MKDNAKVQKPLMEMLYGKELDALRANDKGAKPENWRLSPKAVRTFILGSETPLDLNGEKVAVSKKFYGGDAMVERAIITLAGNRGLMLVGDPGTAKTMLSELLSAAISGISTVTIQGTAGTSEDSIKYSWNYAMLLAKGPVQEALIPSPVYTGMSRGVITRFEEITRCPLEIQDSLISILSDKILNIPELGEDGMIFAAPGFNIIATANTRDKGINEMSSALKRRFNFETVEPVKSVEVEAEIIASQCRGLLKQANIDAPVETDVVELLAATFCELRSGAAFEKAKVQKLSGVMSTAEAVSIYYQSALCAHYYGDGKVKASNLVENLLGAVIKESKEDLPKLRSYFKEVVKLRSEKYGGLWTEYYNGRDLLK